MFKSIYKKNEIKNYAVIIYTITNNMESIIIDNCIVSKFMDNGIRITPIRLAKKMKPSLNIDLLPL